MNTIELVRQISNAVSASIDSGDIFKQIGTPEEYNSFETSKQMLVVMSIIHRVANAKYAELLGLEPSDNNCVEAYAALVKASPDLAQHLGAAFSRIRDIYRDSPEQVVF